MFEAQKEKCIKRYKVCLVFGGLEVLAKRLLKGCGVICIGHGSEPLLIKEQAENQKMVDKPEESKL